MPVAPLWAAQEGADADGVGLVNGILMLATVLTQLMVPAALRRFGWESVLVTGTLFLGLPTAGLFFGDSLGLILLVSGLSGIGFGIITVTGSALIAELVDPMRRGEAIGVYGLAVAAPQILFISTGLWFAERFGFETMFAVGLLPILGAKPCVSPPSSIGTPRRGIETPPRHHLIARAIDRMRVRQPLEQSLSGSRPWCAWTPWAHISAALSIPGLSCSA